MPKKYDMSLLFCNFSGKCLFVKTFCCVKNSKKCEMNDIPKIALSPLPSYVRRVGVSHRNYDCLTLNLENPCDNTRGGRGAIPKSPPLLYRCCRGRVKGGRDLPQHDLDPQWDKSDCLGYN